MILFMALPNLDFSVSKLLMNLIVIISQDGATHHLPNSY